MGAVFFSNKMGQITKFFIIFKDILEVNKEKREKSQMY